MTDCRAATPTDLDRVVELGRELHRELTRLRGGQITAAREARVEPFEPVFATLLDDPDAAVRVGRSTRSSSGSGS